MYKLLKCLWKTNLTFLYLSLNYTLNSIIKNSIAIYMNEYTTVQKYIYITQHKLYNIKSKKFTS